MDMGRFHLDKQSATPLYEQLRAQILDAIRLCELTAGDQLPTEEELCRALDISRPVVQGACKALIRDGYIQRVRGKGTFVRVPDSRGRFINRQLSFQDEMRLLGLPHRTEVLCAEWFPVSYTHLPRTPCQLSGCSITAPAGQRPGPGWPLPGPTTSIRLGNI